MHQPEYFVISASKGKLEGKKRSKIMTFKEEQSSVGEELPIPGSL